jgi:hypothetical protein
LAPFEKEVAAVKPFKIADAASTAIAVLVGMVGALRTSLVGAVSYALMSFCVATVVLLPVAWYVSLTYYANAHDAQAWRRYASHRYSVVGAFSLGYIGASFVHHAIDAGFLICGAVLSVAALAKAALASHRKSSQH